MKTFLLIAVLLFSSFITIAQSDTKPFKEITIRKNESIQLDSVTKMMFLYHSHKKTLVDGPPSPLITYIYYVVSGKSEEKQYNIDFDPEKKFKSGWKWKNYIFVLGKYEYDEFMELQIFKSENYPSDQYQFIISE
jgi:hypothetical protein